jgi:hypothetical protein
MCDDGSFSLVSNLPDIETVYMPQDETSIHMDDVCSLYNDDENDLLSSCSTSLTASVLDHEFAHGRIYHGYKAGKYPLPNDILEQQREETVHLLILEVTVYTKSWKLKALWCNVSNTA